MYTFFRVRQRAFACTIRTRTRACTQFFKSWLTISYYFSKHLSKCIIVTGSNPRGRPKKTWLECIRKDWKVSELDCMKLGTQPQEQKWMWQWSTRGHGEQRIVNRAVSKYNGGRVSRFSTKYWNWSTITQLSAQIRKVTSRLYYKLKFWTFNLSSFILIQFVNDFIIFI